jgi:hypothetical protein
MRELRPHIQEEGKKMSILKILCLVVVLGVLLGSVELIAYGTKVLFLGVLAKLRKHKRDQRIIRQAKAAGVWDKPEALGGRALELKAWQDYKIKRKRGETDACLRLRYTDAAANMCTFTSEEGRTNE